MDEKTRTLRDLFVDVAGEESVTEQQEESRGSLVPDGSIDDQVADVVESMRTHHEFRSSLPTDALVAVVRGFYAGRSDAEIAASLDGKPAADTVARARLDLHLVTDRDREAPFELDALREALDADRSTAEIATDLGVSESSVRRYGHVLDVERQRRSVNDRFRDEFDRLLADSDLAERLTAEARETGLEDATEGAETNVSF